MLGGTGPWIGIEVPFQIADVHIMVSELSENTNVSPGLPKGVPGPALENATEIPSESASWFHQPVPPRSL
jgi:hypothetical protein